MNISSSNLSISREDLYKRVWATPMQRLAVEYGMSDVGLAKICKKHKIPRPSRGYWAKLENGKQVLRFPLPPIRDQSLATVHIRLNPVAVNPVQVRIAADPEIERLIAHELLPENRIECVADLRGADPLVAATRESLSHKTPDDYGRISRRYDFMKACFQVAVSKGNIQRALLLLQSLVKALKSRGHSVSADGSKHKNVKVRILDAEFLISVWESANRRSRELTKKEKADKERWGWTSARDYEHVPSGILELQAKCDSSYSTTKITDSAKARVEDQLNELMVNMLKAVGKHRRQAERARLEALEREKRRQQALELEMLRRTESVREERLLKVLPVWQKAERVKDFVEAVRNKAHCRIGEIEPESEIGS